MVSPIESLVQAAATLSSKTSVYLHHHHYRPGHSVPLLPYRFLDTGPKRRFLACFLVNFSLLDLASFYPCRELTLPETKRVALRETFGRQVTRVHFPAEIPPTRLA